MATFQPLVLAAAALFGKRKKESDGDSLCEPADHQGDEDGPGESSGAASEEVSQASQVLPASGVPLNPQDQDLRLVSVV